MLGVGSALTVTVMGCDFPLQPPASSTSTVYVPAVLTVIVCVVSPVDHVYLANVPASNITLSPSHSVVLLSAVTVGESELLTATVKLVSLEHIAFDSTTLTVAVPAVNQCFVIDDVPLPLVILPSEVTVHV